MVFAALFILVGTAWTDAHAQEGKVMDKGFYGFTMKDIDGNDVPLSKYEGKVLLVVNVASECGFTYQYKGLEELYRKYKDRGFVLLGFPANNFGHQEPGTNMEIKEFCSTKFDVTFPLFSKISVKGDDKDPLYVYLTEDSEIPGEIKWNFYKFLIDRHGKVVDRWNSKTEPMSEELTSAVEKALAEQ
jgi:glutathione peroxidase